MPPIESNAGGDPQLLGSPDLTNGPDQLDRGYETGTITKKLSVSLELMQIQSGPRKVYQQTAKNRIKMFTTTAVESGSHVSVQSHLHISNTIPNKYWKGLDPEWISLWLEHGSKVTPASQVTVEEFRQCPEKYSFTYPTWQGEHSIIDPNACIYSSRRKISQI